MAAEEHDKRLTQRVGDIENGLKVPIIPNFSCRACGHTEQQYTRLVSEEGGCVHCGDTIPNFNAVITELGFGTLHNSVFLVADLDAEAEAAAIAAELNTIGIPTLTSLYLTNNGRQGPDTADLVYIPKHAMSTLVIASARLQSNGVIQTGLREAAHLDAPMLAVYTSSDAIAYPVWPLREFGACVWNTSVGNITEDDAHRFRSKQIILEQLEDLFRLPEGFKSWSFCRLDKVGGVASRETFNMLNSIIGSKLTSSYSSDPPYHLVVDMSTITQMSIEAIRLFGQLKKEILSYDAKGQIVLADCQSQVENFLTSNGLDESVFPRITLTPRQGDRGLM